MPERDLHTEGVVSRAWRDAKAHCVSFVGFVAAGVALIAFGALGNTLADGLSGWKADAVTVLASLFGLLFVVMFAFGLSIIVTPFRQRDEARKALRDVTEDLAAPVVVSLEYDPEPPVVLASRGWGRVYCFLNIRNNHPEDIPGAVLNFDVPRDVRLTRIDSPNKPYSGDAGRSGSSTRGDRTYWLEKNLELPGAGWTYRVSFVLIFTAAGMRDLVVKLRVPGFASVEETFEVEAVRPDQ